MEDQRPFYDLSAAERQAAVRATAIRIAVLVIALLALYVVLPLPTRVGVGTGLALTAGLGALSALVVHQLRAIRVAELPVLKAVEALALAVTLLVVVFSFAYVSLSAGSPASFSEPLDRIDAVYFTMAVLSTVGFGDIAAVSSGARLVVTLQIVVDLLIVVGVARVLTAAVKDAVRRQR